MTKFTLTSLPTMLSTVLVVPTLAQAVIQARGSYAFTIRMEIQDSGLRRLDDEKKLSSIVVVPMRWH